MKDIDFDELDKAVNSLMSTTGSIPELKNDELAETVVDIPSSDGSSVPVTITPTLPPVPASMESVENPIAITATPPPVVTSTPSPNVAPAVRRGRFMDMVQKPTTPVRPAPSAPASREGLLITPRDDSSAPVPSPAQTQTPPTDITTPATSQKAEETTVSFDSMPDPIDMAGVDTPAPTPVQSAPTPVVQLPESLESPFLVDAKVEKRPLNSNLGQELEEAAKEEYETTDEPAPVDSIDNGSDEPPINPQAPELSSDLVAIESGDTMSATQVVETVDAVKQVDAPSTPLGATSIAQQYKSKESSGDQSHAAIYDAAQYPEPLSHPAKSKSGWLWVLWVIGLLGIGAGGAVLLYVLKIIP